MRCRFMWRNVFRRQNPKRENEFFSVASDRPPEGLWTIRAERAIGSNSDFRRKPVPEWEAFPN